MMLHCLRSLHILTATAEPPASSRILQARQAPVAFNGIARYCISTLHVDHSSGNRGPLCKINSISIVQDSIAAPEENNPSVLKQRTEEWQELRQGRLTASSFSTALGFWGNGRRVELWEEKVGLRGPFAGNSATEWGISREAAAVQRYQEITGNVVENLAFKVYKEGDDVQAWLGASPDGLIDEGVSGVYEKAGILEVKCPHNKGRPEHGVPWAAVPYYYIPQVQGLMEILDRDWLDLFVWTLNGSTVFRLDRNPEYWALIFGVLSDFWWASVVPARQALLLQKNVDVNIFQPTAQHRLTPVVLNESKQLARKATLIWTDPMVNIEGSI